MRKNQTGFSLITVLLLVVALSTVGVAGYIVHKRTASNTTTPKTTTEANTETKTTVENNERTLTLDSAPMVSVKHDSSWEQLKEYGYPRDGLKKTIDGVTFLIKFSRTPASYDYMNRAAGGAYPPGKLFKDITANGKQYFIGTTDSVSSAFLSTCAITANGACSLPLPDNYGYMIVDMQRLTPSSSDYAARSPLELSNTIDKKAIEEFAKIMSTIKF